jgi:hypothetical protein
MADRDEWTAPSAVPRPYRLRDRWSDCRWARADGRKNIPLIRQPESSKTAENAPTQPLTVIESAANSLDGGNSPAIALRPVPDGYDPANETIALVTPYMDALRHACNGAVAAVYGRLQDSHVQLHDQLRQAEIRRKAFLIDKEVAQERFAELEKPLGEEQATRARLGEKDWPADMVRIRRVREWSEARLAAQEKLRQLSADLHAAEADVENARQAFPNQLKKAQAVGWQIFHHYARRESTYLGVLARKHKRGQELVRLLRLTGPDLPGWLLDMDGKETDGKEGA